MRKAIGAAAVVLGLLALIVPAAGGRDGYCLRPSSIVRNICVLVG